ncbi:NAD-dependent epimerase/dehydratase family protein [Marivita sp. S0852]|uniref:NAD-dependent epimerase/dehydratase family protein n=1 Tax=Marivita sp. S0852 TaxID=3373893 RepID=UPI003982683D
MGEVKRILLTGASGFIGRATLRAALNAGLEVVAVQRSTGKPQAGVTFVTADLTKEDAVDQLAAALDGCDAVIHLAAAMSGDPDDHKNLTLGGTERVLAAMAQTGVGHMTLASTIAVFDAIQVPIGDALTDDCPLENPALSRDAYSGAKVRQETLARSAGLDSLAIVRPGIVYDTDHVWNAHLGVAVGPILFRIGDDSPLPMCHVDRCAAGLVQATLSRSTETGVILDPELPSRRDTIAALKKKGWPAVTIPLPWKAVWSAARVLRPISGKMPGVLRENVLRQRMLPMGYRFAALSYENSLPNPAPDWGGDI